MEPSERDLPKAVPHTHALHDEIAEFERVVRLPTTHPEYDSDAALVLALLRRRRTADIEGPGAAG